MHDQDAADGDNAFEVGACMCEAATPTGVPLCLLLTLVGTCSAAPSQLAKHIVLLCWTATHSRHRYAELCRALAWPQLTVVSCISGELDHGWVLQRMPAFAAGRITTVPLPQHQRQHSAAGVLCCQQFPVTHPHSNGIAALPLCVGGVGYCHLMPGVAGRICADALGGP